MEKQNLKNDYIRARLIENLSDKLWRLNNLYWVLDEDGNRVKFHLRPTQQRFYDAMHNLDLILKARQIGFTTLIDLYILDDCIFNSNIEAGIIAHNNDDVKKIFRRKILYPWENLNETIKIGRKATIKSKTELGFDNDSIVSVGMSMRSGTLQMLHVSEFGKICARFPERAREVVTGSLQAVKPGNKIWIESTAEGRSGRFFEMCEEAQKVAKDVENGLRVLNKMDYKFHFFAWWQDEKNTSDDPVPIPSRLSDYFERIEAEIGRKFNKKQKYWYVQKEKDLGEDIKREHPSTPKEAFEHAIEGAYFSSEFRKLREKGNICSVPVNDGALVSTWWDLGMDDVTAIWFTQDVGREIHVIDYYQNSGEGFEFYAGVLEEKGYRYGTHNAPHDIKVRELGPGKSRLDTAREYGINFKRVPRCSNKMNSIEAARKLLGSGKVFFDAEKCSDGLDMLEGYRKEWNPDLGAYRTTPLHDKCSNGADAFQTLASGHNFSSHIGGFSEIIVSDPGGWT